MRRAWPLPAPVILDGIDFARVDALTQALNFYRGALSALQRWEAMSRVN